jgi:tetratricopeptide (TPR) repeat protein
MVKIRILNRLAAPTIARTLIGLLVFVISWTANAQDAHSDLNLRSLECGSLKNHYGPWDYTNPVHYKEKLPIVENAHFNSDVENLRRGARTNSLPGDDLDYTLRAFPNHHRALYSMARYALQEENYRKPRGSRYSGDCWFDRALRFKPDDPAVRLIFGVYLSQQKKYSEAIEQLEFAVNLDSNSSEAHYNLGLLYEKTDALEKAVQHARIAYDLGYPLEGLKNKLRRRGVWDAE